jgi:hypothetical protein
MVTSSTGPALAAPSSARGQNGTHVALAEPTRPSAHTGHDAQATIASGTNCVRADGDGCRLHPQSVIIDGIRQTTVYVSSTSLTVAAALKKTTAGTLA